MVTFNELLTSIQQERFVGRSAELRALHQWLTAAEGPVIFALSGPGGMGKSWLLDAFSRQAERNGWRRSHIDPGALGPTAAGTPALLVIDGVDDADVAARVAEYLATVEAGSKVLLAGRSGFRSGVWRRWQPLMRHLELGQLDPWAQREYLDVRGLDDRARRGRVLLRAGGNPLILSLAVDLLLNSPDAGLASSDVWRSTVRATVDELVAGLGMQFRDALDAAAVLHRFDRAGLAAILESEMSDAAFVRLCASSTIRVEANQLALHDDVRRAVIEDLRLHHPDRLDQLRRRALRYYRKLASSMSADEGRHYAVERLHLVGRDIFGINLLYGDESEVTVGAAACDDIEQMLQLLKESEPVVGVPRVEQDPALARPLLEHPDTFAQVAKDADGSLLAYGFYVRVTESSRQLLGSTPAMAAYLDEVAARLGHPSGGFPQNSNVFYLSTLIVRDDVEPSVIPSMSRQIMHMLLAEGAYLMVPARLEYVSVSEGVLSERVLPHLVEDGVELNGRLLDLSRRGIEGWLRDIMAGGPLALSPIGQELAGAIRVSVDAGTRSDAPPDAGAFASPVLVGLTDADDDTPPSEQEGAVRDLLARSITATGPWPSPELRVRDAIDAGGAALRQAVEQAIGPRADPVTASGESGEPAAEAIKPIVVDESGVTTVRLLGGFEVRRGSAPLELPTGTVATVVKVVALRAVIAVEELIEILWPDTDPAVGRERLRTVLARVRRALGPGVVVRDDEAVTLSPAAEVDARTFDERARAAISMAAVAGASEADRARAAEIALAGYGGELLPADRFADWAVAPRERLRHQYLALLDVVAEHAERSGDIQHTLQCLESGIEAEPYEEQRYLRAARLLAEDGRRGTALAMLQRAEAAAASLGVSPSNDVVALRRMLRNAG